MIIQVENLCDENFNNIEGTPLYEKIAEVGSLKLTVRYTWENNYQTRNMYRWQRVGWVLLLLSVSFSFL